MQILFKVKGLISAIHYYVLLQRTCSQVLLFETLPLFHSPTILQGPTQSKSFTKIFHFALWSVFVLDLSYIHDAICVIYDVIVSLRKCRAPLCSLVHCVQGFVDRKENTENVLWKDKHQKWMIIPALTGVLVSLLLHITYFHNKCLLRDYFISWMTASHFLYMRKKLVLQDFQNTKTRRKK